MEDKKEQEFNSLEEILQGSVYVRGTNLLVHPIKVEYKPNCTLITVDFMGCAPTPECYEVAASIVGEVPLQTGQPWPTATPIYEYSGVYRYTGVFHIKNLSKVPYGTEIGKRLYSG